MRIMLPVVASIVLLACQTNKETAAVGLQAQNFLNTYNTTYQQLYTKSSNTQWTLNTHIVKGDTISQKLADDADQAFAQFTGSKENIDSAKKYLALKDQLSPIQLKQFETVLFNAGNNPQTAKAIVDARIKTSNEQTAKLYGFKYFMDGKAVSTGYLDSILQNSTNLTERLKAWTASKEVGKSLKSGMDSLRRLRNGSVTPLNYKDFFDYNAREYGMGEDDILQLTRQFIAEVWPLYRELHTWARYELAASYQRAVPDFIPAHWLPNRWGQDWSSLVKVKGLNIDSVLSIHGSEWIPKQSEAFYKSIGFEALPTSFWEKSSLYPVPANSPFSKNNHASAWHLDLEKDVRSLQSITPTTDYWGTALHEFGHIYYFLSYTNPGVPPILRSGANRGFHEAFGTMMGLASLQKPFLENLKLVPAGLKTNDTLKLLNEALQYIVNIPWGSGVMTEFEYQLYAKNLSPDNYNKTWWELVKKYQGIVPPTERGETYNDAASKTHITDDPAQYYDYSIANILVFQFHTYIAEKILHQDPHATNYWGNKAVGDFLKRVMQPGASIDWRENIKTNLGSDMSAKPMVDYFKPLVQYLKRVNTGRKYTLPEKL